MKTLCRLTTKALLLGILWIQAGCKPPERARITSQSPVCILDTGPITTECAAWQHLVLQIYPEAAICSEQELNSLSPEDRRVVLVPDSSSIPSFLWKPIDQALNRGVPLLFMGRNPFQQRIVLTDQGPETAADRIRTLMAQAKRPHALPDIAIWSHVNDSGTLRGRVHLTDSPAERWPAVQVDIEDFAEWDVLEGRVSEEGLPELANGLCFYARGSTATSRLLMECSEQDGSRWIQALTLKTQWQPFVLQAQNFQYLRGGRNRGGANDHLNLAQTASLRIGLNAEHAPQAPGEHRFSVSDFRMAFVPETGLHPRPPTLPMLFPAYDHFDFSAHEFLAPSGQDYVLQRARLQSPVRYSQGQGRAKDAPFRWQALGVAQGNLGERGWPVSLWLDTHGDTLRKYGWIATDPGGPARELLPEMVQQAVRTLKQNTHLISAGTGAASCKPGALLNVHISWHAGSEPAAPLRLATELLDENGTVLRRVTSSRLEDDTKGLQHSVLHAGRAPTIDSSRRFRIRTRLEEALGSGRVLDEIDCGLSVIPPQPKPEAREQIQCSGGRFFYRRAPIFMLGQDYEPQYRPLSMDKADHWLEAHRYDSDAVRQDLDRLMANGLNTISIEYTALSQVPQLLDLFDAARELGLWIYLRVPAFNPLDPELKTGLALVEALDLPRHPEVFALCLSGAATATPGPPLNQFDPEWHNWVLEQYGSVAHAEHVLGTTLWTTNEGRLTHPPLQELQASPKSASIIAYKRFANDLVSRRIGTSVRLLRDMQCPQLISARTSFMPKPGTLPAAPSAGAIHLDFISPDVGFLHGSLDDFYEAGFLAAYARGFSNGKPLLWLDFGCDVGPEPSDIDLQNQARVYRNMFELVDNSVAAGCIGQHTPGGWDPIHQTDTGMLNPSGTARPALILHREMVHRQRQTTMEIQGWKGRTLPLDTASLPSLWDQWREVYRTETQQAAIEELRPEDFSALSTQFIPLGPDDTAWENPAPMKSLNSEWGHIHLRSSESDHFCMPPYHIASGQTLELHLINTGPMTWVRGDSSMPGTVCVEAKGPNQQRELIPLPQTPYEQTARLTWRPPSSGLWTLRAWLNGYGGFGEDLTLSIAPLDLP